MRSPHATSGKRYKSADKERDEVLVVGGDGVAVEHSDGSRTVRFVDVVGHLRWDDGSVGCYSNDGFYVLVEPTDWKDGADAARRIAERLDPQTQVDVSNDPPVFDDAELLRGLEAYEREDWEESVRLLRSWLAREPSDAEAWGRLAWALSETDAPALALDAAREAADRDRRNPWAIRFMIRQLLESGHRLAAAHAAHEAIADSPVDLETLALAADAFSNAGWDERAVRIGRRATELFPEEARAWFAYGWAARAASEWEIARTALQRCVELDPDEPQWHNNLGVALLDIGLHREALAAFDKALKLDKTHRFARSNRAIALQLLGRRADAAKEMSAAMAPRIEESAAALAAAPDDPVAVERHARMLLIAEHYAEATALARRAVELQPTAERLRLVATLESWVDRMSDARAAATRGLELDPEHPDLLEEQSRLAALDGDSAIARAAAERAASAGDRRVALFSDGCACVAEQRWDEAEHAFSELLRLRPRSCCSLAWRGIARLGGGDVDGARADAAGVESLSPWRCISHVELERRLALA